MEIVESKYDGIVIVGTHYRCVGSVRGWCGVRHRSNHAAIRCRERDSNGCASQGGYSDRVVCLCDDDGRVKDTELVCHNCGETVEPEADRVGCGSHCPECDATL